MSWALILLLVLLLVGILWRFAGFRGAKLQFLCSALLLGLAGYAWQGRPDLQGQPKAKAVTAMREPSAFQQLRGAFLPQFDSAARWLILSDSYMRRGNSGEAVAALRAGLKREPRNMTLWTAMGYALTIHGGGMNQAAELAYRRAAAIAPEHPAPRFFYGLSLAESGSTEEAERVWRSVLAAAPPGASWRPLVAGAIQFLGSQPPPGEAPPRA